jgi:hypothetical protein
VRLLVFDLLGTLDSASMLLVSHLGQDEFLVLPVGLELELSLGVDEHLLLADVTEESVAFLLTRLLEANEVIFEAVVGLLLGLLGLAVDLLSLVLIMTVNGIGTLSVQESGVPGVVGVRNILSVEGAADNVVQLAVGVTVQAAFFSCSISLNVV